MSCRKRYYGTFLEYCYFTLWLNWLESAHLIVNFYFTFIVLRGFGTSLTASRTTILRDHRVLVISSDKRPLTY